MLRFTTNAYPKEQRWDAWRFALQRKSLKLETVGSETIYGELSSFLSGQGMDVISVAATPQKITIDLSEQPDFVWLVQLLEGELQAGTGVLLEAVQEGDIIFGESSVVAALDFRRDNRFLFVKVPKSILSLRIHTPLPSGVTHISSHAGSGRVMSGMLRSVADTINDLTIDQIRPVELSLPEFILTALMENAPVKALGGSAGARAMLLQRVFQTIEMRLSDPNLNLQQVAKEHGISMRYLQKLFETEDESFGHYVKLRRLERCRMDLLSPLHAQKSISDILFQWGFNDSASFSRAFREQYGTSPREYRKSPPTDREIAEIFNRGRPDVVREQKASKDEDHPASDDPILEEEENPGFAPTRAFAGYAVAAGVRHHFLPATPATVHWGYLNKNLKPVLEVQSFDYVTVETLTHHASDDYERMIEGDPGAEAIYRWDASGKAVERRGAGPMDASAVGRGAGEGFGVHICTGPIAVAGARPGDIIEVRFIEVNTRPSRNARFAGRTFGSNLAAYWGFHYHDLLTEPKPREVVTIYEVETNQGRACAHAVYNFRYTPQTDPYGICHHRYDYPGVPIDQTSIEKNFDVLRNVEIPVRPHFGMVALAPAQDDMVDSVPPGNFGGNMDNWRLGPGASIFLPVNVAGGLLSIGDPHASQGDSELCGTAIECSMTAMIQVILHPKENLRDPLNDLDYPLIETKDEWVIMGFSQPNYLRELGDKAQSEIYKKSSVDLAMRDAFRKARRFLMTSKDLSEDEAISLLSVGVDFGITQVVNGNWGCHAIIRKALFTA